MKPIKMPAAAFFKKHWFFWGLCLVVLLTIGDTRGLTGSVGTYCKINYGPEILIFSIFLISGFLLDAEKVKKGMGDLSVIAGALTLIFLIAPVLAAFIGRFIADPGVRIGLFLVAVMPTTLSSGVVMTGVAGGNTACGLLITIFANALSILTIPFTLSLLMSSGDTGSDPVAAMTIDKAAMIFKLLFLVLIPLAFGILFRHRYKGWEPSGKRLQAVNQILILLMVWMALSQSRHTLIHNREEIFPVLFLVFAYHGIMLAAAVFSARLFRIGAGRREALIFMGGQKTLTLSIILQVSLFPQYGMALLFCVLHHIVHLMMDGYLAGYYGEQASEILRKRMTKKGIRSTFLP